MGACDPIDTKMSFDDFAGVFASGKMSAAYALYQANAVQGLAFPAGLPLSEFAEKASDLNLDFAFWNLEQDQLQALSDEDIEACCAVLDWHNHVSYMALFLARIFGDAGLQAKARAVVDDHHRQGGISAETKALREEVFGEVSAIRERAKMQPVAVVEGEVVDELFQQNTLPTLHSPLEHLFSMHDSVKAAILHTAEVANSVDGGVFSYFVTGARNTHGLEVSLSKSRLFDPEAAVRALDADFWGKAIALTDVMSYMPAKRRNEWRQMMRTGFLEKAVQKQDKWGHWHTEKVFEPIPMFSRDTVKSTLAFLIESRQQFFAERVDGIWDSLSSEHLTNSPAAFRKRMIMKRVINYYGHLDHDMAGYIHDLRLVIAKFMGRDDPESSMTVSSLDRIVDSVMKKNGSGKWHLFDGGAFKVRMYKVGTAHMEIHPDIAVRLNGVLATLRPMAIPPEFRTREKKKPKDRTLVHELISNEVLLNLSRVRVCRTDMRVLQAPFDQKLLPAAKEVLAYLGGVEDVGRDWKFDYVEAYEALQEVLRTGMLPDRQSYQYYPTPESLAEEVVEWAEIDEADECLEPSAGQGGLAKFMPKDRTLCLELSTLHAKVLEVKGFRVENTDFLYWHPKDVRPTRICMNPPFTGGQAEAHLLHAAEIMAPGGVLVAVLPSGFKGKELLPGGVYEWSDYKRNQFVDASVTVVILKWRKPL